MLLQVILSLALVLAANLIDVVRLCTSLMFVAAKRPHKKDAYAAEKWRRSK